MDVGSVAYEPIKVSMHQPAPAANVAGGSNQQNPQNPQTGGSTDVKAAESPQQQPQVKQADAAEAQVKKDAQHKQESTNEYLQKTIDHVNKSVYAFNRELKVSVHDKTKRIMVKVMDTSDNSVIREIPPEKVLDAFARTLELAGILVDKKR
jgi:flagellar protein FlaG